MVGAIGQEVHETEIDRVTTLAFASSMATVKLGNANEPKHRRSRSYHAAKADEDSQHIGGSRCATIHGCSPFSSASRPRLDCPLVYQPRKAVSDSRRRRSRRFTRQWLPECCPLKSSSNSIWRGLPLTIGLVLGSTRSSI